MTTREEGTFEWLMKDELRGQRVLATLAQELGNEHAKKIFYKIFYVHEPEVTSIALGKGNGPSSLN